jgi:hypothetical protein
MSDNAPKLAERLFKSEKLNPTLEASYREELSNLLEPKLTARKAWPGAALLVILLFCIGGIVRNLLVYEARPLLLFRGL